VRMCWVGEQGRREWLVDRVRAGRLDRKLLVESEGLTFGWKLPEAMIVPETMAQMLMRNVHLTRAGAMVFVCLGRENGGPG
jgi:hypothetical protein